jgi:hypothetical protein
MISGKLLHLIAAHREEITAGAIRRIRNDDDIPHIQALSDRELRNWARGLLEALESKALGGDDVSMTLEYRDRGRLRFETSVNLYEVVRCLHILKLKILEFVRNRGFAQSSIEIYAQEEIEHYVGLFFDWALYNIVRGYEEAQHTAARLAHS